MSVGVENLSKADLPMTLIENTFLNYSLHSKSGNFYMNFTISTSHQEEIWMIDFETDDCKFWYIGIGTIGIQNTLSYRKILATDSG